MKEMKKLQIPKMLIPSPLKAPRDLPLSISADGLWWAFIQKNWVNYTSGTFATGLTCFCQVMIPLVLGWAIDHLKGGKLHIPLWFPHQIVPFVKEMSYLQIFILFLLLQLTLMGGRIGWRVFLARPTFYAGAWLRDQIWERARYFTQQDLDQNYTTGVLMNSSTSDVNSSRFIFGFTLVALFDVLFLGLFTLVMMFSLNREMTLWVLMLVPILPFFIRRLGKKESELFDQAQESLAVFNDLSSQAIGTIRLQKLTQTGEFWEKKLLEIAENYRQRRLKAVQTSLLFFPTMGMGTIFSFSVLFLLGAQKVFSGQLSVGEFLTMQSYVILIQDPLIELGYIVSEWQRARTGLKRLQEIYQHVQDESLLRPPTVAVSTPEKDQNQEVIPVYSVKDLQLTVEKRVLFSHLSFELMPQERLGITGKLGTGKSQLLLALAKLKTEGLTGQIKLYGRDLHQYSHQELRSLIGQVPQRPFLFAQSIRENVQMDQLLSDEEIWHYLSLAGLDHDVMQFPDGLHTPLGEWGINLSGGQKQRLTIARALVRRPSVLFLDDCLSAVDTVTEEKIIGNLNQELKKTTLIWVAHRKSTLKYCDRIMDLDYE